MVALPVYNANFNHFAIHLGFSGLYLATADYFLY